MRVALITGAGGAGGAAVCSRLAGEGFAIAAVDVDSERLAGTAERVRAGGGTAIAITADVCDRVARERALDRASAELGPVSVLVNGARWFDPRPVVESSVDDWDRTLSVAVKASLTMTQDLARRLIEQGAPGAVVNLGSSARVRRAPRTSILAASQGGLDALTKGMALELAEHRIRVNSVLGDSVTTADREALASAVAFLISPAAGYVTGSCFETDGRAPAPIDAPSS